MVALDIVLASNAKLREFGPGLVALFVGATSGIGEYTAKAFVKNALSPKVYIVGRNQAAAERIIAECQELNKDSTVSFLKADATELGEVDRVCEEIKKREEHVNLIVQSQGNLNMRGRDENSEGLDRKFTLNYYSRMRFISNLLPLLRNASNTAPHFSRTLSVLGAGRERAVDFEDLELKKTFSRSKCAAHSIVMTDFMMEELAKREPRTTFTHSFPSLVNTGAVRELPVWLRVPLKGVLPLMAPFMVNAEETGARQLFIATSGMYPPRNPAGEDPLAKGIAAPSDLPQAFKGTDGKEGSGGYIVNWNNDITGNENILNDYRAKGVGQIVWEHTMGIFDRVEKINEGKANVK